MAYPSNCPFQTVAGADGAKKLPLRLARSHAKIARVPFDGGNIAFADPMNGLSSKKYRLREL
jgi:hypothetical protein